jgi:cephalosporin hydroxylase/glycosyltransferase involved in cell wall biosynthesis
MRNRMAAVAWGLDEMSVKFPIIVMSFNRPNYLAKVLTSIRNQNGIELSDRPILLFQDAAVSPITGKRYADDSQIELAVRTFKSVFPEGKVMLAEHNLGICRNFRRAESYVFEFLKAECAYFFEDDMVLSPNYFSIMDRIADFALTSGRIGYFAAYGNHTIPLEEQMRRSSVVGRLEHHWAFGLVRHHWLELNEWLKPYYDMLEPFDYRDRPTPEIIQYYRARGLPVGVSSQDDVKKVGTYKLGRASINTIAVFAKYIGEKGESMRSDKFAEHGYDNTQIFPTIPNLNFPNDDEIDGFIQREFAGRWRNINGDPSLIESKSAELAKSTMYSLHSDDIFSDFEPLPSADMQGWNGRHPAMEKAIAETRPRYIIDVRVWKGQSSLFMADLLKKLSIEGIVISVDTFSGIPEHWKSVTESAFRFKNGRPLLYEQFMTNIIASSHQNRIVPLCLSPIDAIRYLRSHGVASSFVHIDSAKDYETVYAEMLAYWAFLSPGGILMGDDFAWPHVEKAVRDFSKQARVEFEVSAPKWIFRKPREVAVADGEKSAVAAA